MRKRAYLLDMDGVLVDNCLYHVLSWLDRVASPLAEKETIYRELHRPDLVARKGLIEFLKGAKKAGIARLLDELVAAVEQCGDGFCC